MADQHNHLTSLEEPSVLDWFKAVLLRRPGPSIPPLPAEDQLVQVRAAALEDDATVPIVIAVPWRILAALLTALAGQFAWSGTPGNAALGLGFYLMAFTLTLWAWRDGELSLATPETHLGQTDDLLVRFLPLVAGTMLSAAAFLMFGGNRFTELNVLLWLAGFGLVVWGMAASRPGWFDGFRAFLNNQVRQPRENRFILLFVLALGVGIFFRVYQLGAVVQDMFSDHAEKLWDVYDILEGQFSIYFRRNTGREGLQMYLIAATIKLFGTGISFLSMKIGTVFLGIFMLPYTYLLGKELGSRWVGLLAMLLAGIAFWPNVLARVALRFIFYPAFAAPAIYHIVRGLRRMNRNDFIWAGVFLGLGLHGYSPFRIVPLMVAAIFGLFILHERQPEKRKQAVVWLGVAAFIALILFLPLLRFWFEEPGLFSFRMMSRMSEVEQVYSGPPLKIFLGNAWEGLKMFNWSSGTTWVVTITEKPSLDPVTGSLFLLGLVLVTARYLRRRRWEDLFLVAAIPILQLPSTLSLAFPNENPAPNRAGGAMVVVFVLAALGLEAVLRGIRDKIGGSAGLRAAVLSGLLLVSVAMSTNYTMMFETFHQQYQNSMKNTSEMGEVIQQYTETNVNQKNVWVVRYPHWVDTRLVAINAGFLIFDPGLWPDEIEGGTMNQPGPKLFLYKHDDTEAGRVLAKLYPEGSLSLYEARNETKNFFIYYVP